MTPDPAQRPCEYHSPEQSPHSSGGEVLFKWNKAQITQASPSKQAGICVCPEQDSIQVTRYLSKEARKFCATFSPTCLLAVSGAAVAPAQLRAPSCSHQLADGEPALLLSANRQRSAGLYLPLESTGSTGLWLLTPACEHTRSHLGGSPQAIYSLLPYGLWYCLGYKRHPKLWSCLSISPSSTSTSLLLVCMGFSAAIEQSSTMPAPFIRTRTFGFFI